MNLFKDAKLESAYLKFGIYGDAGSGKSYTASKVAIGLHKFIKAKKPVYFLDSETGSDYLIPMFEKAKIKLKVAKTKAFSALLDSITEAEKDASIFLVDSLTHPWDDLIESYKKKKKIIRMNIQHWGEVKPVWHEFSNKLVMSSLHIIICGRAGDVWENVVDNEGYTELKKTGTKMRLEKETSYEPSLLVEMVKVRESSQPGAGWTHRAWVVKDRFDVIDSQHFDNPTFESFLPHIKLLNLGGEHRALEVGRDSQELFNNEQSGGSWHKTHEILLDEIKSEMSYLYPGTTVEAKKSKMDLSQKLFNAKSWERVKTRSNEELKEGRDKIKALNEEKTKKEKKQ